MNRTDRLERELTAWLVAGASPRTPDYTDDILRQTARLRQRSRWIPRGRWLSMSEITLVRVFVRPVPWRTMGLLAILVLLLGLAAAYVGGQRRLPAPFGQAANGLIAYTESGDIYTVDPETGARRAIVTGPTFDLQPEFSLDGTRIAFVRADSGVVIASADGGHQVVADTGPLAAGDTVVAWSPDGRSIAVTSTVGGTGRLWMVDADDGETRALDVGMSAEAVSWRPPDGRELLFLGRTTRHAGLYLVGADGTGLHEVVLSVADTTTVLPLGWLPTGDHLAFHAVDPLLGVTRIHVVDAAGGADVVIGSSDGDRFHAGYGRLSNDGGQVVFLDGGDAGCVRYDSCNWLSVAKTSGGPATRLTEEYPAPYGTHYAWSPDDRWIITRPASGRAMSLLDPARGTRQEPPWASHGGESWQRVAP